MPDQLHFEDPATANATNASAIVVAANSRRTYLLVTNLTTEPIYLAVGNAAVLNSGIPLMGKGASYEMLARGANLSYQAVYAIHDGGAVDNAIAIQEAV